MDGKIVKLCGMCGRRIQSPESRYFASKAAPIRYTGKCEMCGCFSEHLKPYIVKEKTKK